MSTLRRELIIKRARNGFVLRVDYTPIEIFATKEELLAALEKVLGPFDPDKIPIEVPMEEEAAMFKVIDRAAQGGDEAA